MPYNEVSATGAVPLIVRTGDGASTSPRSLNFGPVLAEKQADASERAWVHPGRVAHRNGDARPRVDGHHLPLPLGNQYAGESERYVLGPDLPPPRARQAAGRRSPRLQPNGSKRDVRDALPPGLLGRDMRRNQPGHMVHAGKRIGLRPLPDRRLDLHRRDQVRRLHHRRLDLHLHGAELAGREPRAPSPARGRDAEHDPGENHHAVPRRGRCRLPQRRPNGVRTNSPPCWD
jgi:hypothetical protein